MKIGAALDKELGTKQMQAAIDNAKRRYAIDIMKTIRDIRNDMDMDVHRLPLFWQSIKDKNDLRQLNDLQKKEMKKQKNAERAELNKIRKRVHEIQMAIDNEEFIPEEDYEYLRWAKKYEEGYPYNSKLVCPMNSVYRMKVNAVIESTETYEMDKFFKQFELKEERRKCRKVENIIQEYSLQLKDHNTDSELDDDSNLLLMNNFEKMIDDIKRVYISKNYLGLMSWLINRAFMITAPVRGKIDVSQSTLKKNRSLLLKTLYTVNKDAFLMCFSRNME